MPPHVGGGPSHRFVVICIGCPVSISVFKLDRNVMKWAGIGIGGALRRMGKVWRWTTPAEAEREEIRHWRSCSIEERVSAVETIRQATIGIYNEAPATGASSSLC